LVKNSGAPALLALNKIDRLRDKGQLLPLIEKYKAVHEFAEYIPISALTGQGTGELRDAILARLPEGPQYFPPDYITDQPERFLAAELIREKTIAETRQEVPHSVAVIVDQWEETPKLTRISATIYVEKDGQKGIIIGSKGVVLKKIGTLARQEMELLLSRKIFLELFVKVRPHWREDPRFLAELDWRSMAGAETE
ncbi:MAG: GTPase Era, partial [Acidobacteria bacterium]|nr:GTPase Era [Acidobacteriota bacterium]